MEKAQDDILFTMTDARGNGFYLRVASRHGHQSAPELADGLRSMLRPDVRLEYAVETPSRFSTEPNA